MRAFRSSEAARTTPLFLGKYQVQLDGGEDNCKAFRHINPNAYLHINGAFHWITQEMPVPVQAFDLCVFCSRPGWR